MPNKKNCNVLGGKQQGAVELTEVLAEGTTIHLTGWMVASEVQLSRKQNTILQIEIQLDTCNNLFSTRAIVASAVQWMLALHFTVLALHKDY